MFAGDGIRNLGAKINVVGSADVHRFYALSIPMMFLVLGGGKVLKVFCFDPIANRLPGEHEEVITGDVNVTIELCPVRFFLV